MKFVVIDEKTLFEQTSRKVMFLYPQEKCELIQYSLKRINSLDKTVLVPSVENWCLPSKKGVWGLVYPFDGDCCEGDTLKWEAYPQINKEVVYSSIVRYCLGMLTSKSSYYSDSRGHPRSILRPFSVNTKTESVSFYPNTNTDFILNKLRIDDKEEFLKIISEDFFDIIPKIAIHFREEIGSDTYCAFRSALTLLSSHFPRERKLHLLDNITIEEDGVFSDKEISLKLESSLLLAGWYFLNSPEVEIIEWGILSYISAEDTLFYEQEVRPLILGERSVTSFFEIEQKLRRVKRDKSLLLLFFYYTDVSYSRVISNPREWVEELLLFGRKINYSLHSQEVKEEKSPSPSGKEEPLSGSESLIPSLSEELKKKITLFFEKGERIPLNPHFSRGWMWWNGEVSEELTFEIPEIVEETTFSGCLLTLERCFAPKNYEFEDDDGVERDLFFEVKKKILERSYFFI